MIGFTGTSLLLTIIYDSWESISVYDTFHSLLDHKRSFFLCDEWRRIVAHTLNCLKRRLFGECSFNQSQSQSYFTTGALPPISSSWRQAPWNSLDTWVYNPYVTSPPTWGWVCRLQLLLVLASEVIFPSEDRETHDQILLSQIRDSPNMEGQVSVYTYIPREQCCLLLPLDTVFPFRRFPRLTGLRWRYSTPPPHGIAFCSLKSLHGSMEIHVKWFVFTKMYFNHSLSSNELFRWECYLENILNETLPSNVLFQLAPVNKDVNSS
jgi:hypothetical protein